MAMIDQAHNYADSYCNWIWSCLWTSEAKRVDHDLQKHLNCSGVPEKLSQTYTGKDIWFVSGVNGFHLSPKTNWICIASRLAKKKTRATFSSNQK